jgi:bacteriocin biosynthesis cyclodehydratase domain-containing protein
VRPLPTTLCLPANRSVLPRGSGARQLGLDPATAVAVDQLPPALAEMIDELAAPTEVAGLVGRAVARGADRERAVDLLHELLEAGAVIDAAALGVIHRRRSEALVVVTGDGPLGIGVAAGLARAGVPVQVETSGRVCGVDLGTGYLDTDRGRLRAEAATDALARLVPGRRPAPLAPRPDLVVLADALAPDPVRVAGLLADRVAHLPVRLRDGTGVVGPLVLPGRSTCLACLELHRCARDPGWPLVAAQLVGTPGRADPACAVATAGLGAAQALLALATGPGAGPPPVLGATLELDPTAGLLTRRPWSARPECPCGAAARPPAVRGTPHPRPPHGEDNR